MLIVIPFDPEDRQEVPGPEDVVDALVGGSRDEQGDVLEDEAHADRGDERGELGRVAEWLVGDALDADVEPGSDQHRDREDEQDDPDLQQDRGVAGQPEHDRDQEEGEHRAEHEHVAVGEVDELDDPVDEGVAERDQGEDQTVGHADHFGLEKLLGPGDQDANHLEGREQGDADTGPA